MQTTSTVSGAPGPPRLFRKRTVNWTQNLSASLVFVRKWAFTGISSGNGHLNDQLPPATFDRLRRNGGVVTADSARCANPVAHKAVMNPCRRTGCLSVADSLDDAHVLSKDPWNALFALGQEIRVLQIKVPRYT